MDHQDTVCSRCLKLTCLGFMAAWLALLLLLIRLFVVEVWENNSSIISQAHQLASLPDMISIIRWGSNGTGVKVNLENLHPIHLQEYKDGYRAHAFNTYLSNRISLRRSLPDMRNKACPQRSIVSTTASVVIVFRDEPWTTLLRTVYSVMDRSPPEAIQEILLIDDGSTLEVLINPMLEHYLSVLKKVRIIRLPQQHGIARARMLGARQSSGDVIVFLHSRCECTDGWMEPLLKRLEQDSSVIAGPVVDSIDRDTFEYVVQPVQVATFTWELKTTRRYLIDLPYSAVDGQPSPVIMDGIFAVNKKVFFALGGYDTSLVLDTNANVELSFRWWMCAGGIEVVPCSHVGFIPSPVRLESQDELELLNIHDCLWIADIWLDNFKDFLYERLSGVPDKPLNNPTTVRTNLRKNLTCHDFRWYLEHVEPVMLFTKNISRRGKLNHTVVNKTVLLLSVMDDAVILQEWYYKPVTIWYLTDTGEINTENNTCLSLREVPYSHAQGISDNDVLKVLFQDLKYSLEDELQLKPQSFSNFKYDQAQHFPQPILGLNLTTSRSFKDHLSHPLYSSETMNRRWLLNHRTLEPEAGTWSSHQLGSAELQRKMLPESKYEATSMAENDLKFQVKDLSRPMFEVDTVLSNKISPRNTKVHKLKHPLPKALYPRERTRDNSQLVKRDATAITYPTQLKQPASTVRYDIILQACKHNIVGDHWILTETGALRHTASGLCLAVQSLTTEKYLLQMMKCDSSSPSQVWSFSDSIEYFKRLLARQVLKGSLIQDP